MRFQIQRRISHREPQGVSKKNAPACCLPAYLPFLGHSAFLQFVFSCNLYFLFTIALFSAVCPFAQKFAVVCPIALCDGAHLQFFPYRPASEGGCTEYFWQNVKKYCWKILICVTINMLWEE